MSEIKKENKFFALVIKQKDWSEFIELHPEAEPLLSNIQDVYGSFRQSKGREPYPSYIICNQDEPYAEKVWQTILQGEKEKLREITTNSTEKTS